MLRLGGSEFRVPLVRTPHALKQALRQYLDCFANRRRIVRTPHALRAFSPLKGERQTEQGKAEKRGIFSQARMKKGDFAEVFSKMEGKKPFLRRKSLILNVFGTEYLCGS